MPIPYEIETDVLCLKEVWNKASILGVEKTKYGFVARLLR